MFHSLLILLALQPSCLCAVHTVHRIRPLHRPALYCSLTLLTMDLLWILNQCVLPHPNVVLNLMIIFAGFFYLPFFAVDGHKLHAIFSHALVMTMTLVLIIIIEHVLITLSPILHVNPRRLMDMGDPLYFLVILVNACIVIPALLILSRIMRKCVVASSGTPKLLWFLIIPISQAGLLILVNENLEYRSNLNVWAFILSGALLCIAADFACILGYRKYHELEFMADQVRQAEQQLNTQNEYYREMQENIIRINRIRHDLNNQLKTAYYLLEQGHPDEVRKQLDSLQSCIQDRIGTKYCENLMVDAVLKEKAAQCRSYGIPLSINALVPADLKLDSAHLCSAFSNLLDNSIAAARKAGPDSGAISLRSDIHKGYLMIACSNPSVSPHLEKKEDILRRHGLGLEILTRLSRLHKGSLETDYRDGRFYVNMMLKNE